MLLVKVLAGMYGKDSGANNPHLNLWKCTSDSGASIYNKMIQDYEITIMFTER